MYVYQIVNIEIELYMIDMLYFTDVLNLNKKPLIAI